MIQCDQSIDENIFKTIDVNLRGKIYVTFHRKRSTFQND